MRSRTILVIKHFGDLRNLLVSGNTQRNHTGSVTLGILELLNHTLDFPGLDVLEFFGELCLVLLFFLGLDVIHYKFTTSNFIVFLSFKSINIISSLS